MAYSASSAAPETKDLHFMGRQNPRRNSTPNRSQQPQSADTEGPRNCTRCGTQHKPRHCPAYGQKCHKCNRKNHFAKVCAARNIHGLEEPQEGQSSDEEFFLGSVVKYVNAASTKDENAWFVEVKVCESRVKMKVDTGAEANIIPMKTWKKIKGTPQLTKSSTKLKALSNSFLEHHGSGCAQFQVGEITAPGEVFVTKDKTTPILGLHTSMALGLISQGDNFPKSHLHAVNTEAPPLTLEMINNEYTDVFKGLGKYPQKYTIRLKDDAQPTIQPPRRVPQAIHDPLKKKLADMMQRQVIEPVDQPTDWVHNLVIAEKKDGSLRLCLDPKQLNESIRREHYQIPTFEEVATQLSGKKYFTIFDQKDSFWQVELDDESSLLCTFTTPFGRYRFRRMPFGISSASEVLQKMAYKTFGDIENVHVIYDDMLIAANTEEEHDCTLKKVLDRARQQNVKFNMTKTQFKKSEVLYLGMRISVDGVRPDEAKVKAITEMSEPTDKDGVRRVVGMVNFLSPFIPNKSSIISPLCNLLKEGTPFKWMPEQKTALDEIKGILSSEPLLKFYDPSQPVVIQADSSSTGLGATIMQNNQPLAYASRALTDAETRYAQIEKELLAIVFATEKFHHYIYGQEVSVQSDHKPLEMIIRKPLHKASPRLQSMLLRLQKYRLKITYTPGAKMHLADTLSRAYLPTDTEPQQEPVLRIHSAVAYFPATPEKLQDIRTATSTDPTLIKLQDFTLNGWPKHKGNLPLDLYAYWPLRESIHIEEDLLLIENKIIMPTEYRRTILHKLHEGHLGMEKCKARAREIMFWPNMNRDIEEYVANCATCATYKPNNTREPLIPHDVPERPWSKLGTDLFSFGGHDYIVVVDYFSKYPEVSLLRDKTADGVIAALQPIFARHGIPDTVVADNMPFSSHRMKEFAKAWGFTVITSSPRYPQSNGQSEKFVGTVKQLLRKAHHEGQDPHLALLQYRNTPVSGLKYSPAQLLMSRRLKDTLPTTTSLLIPTVAESARNDLQRRQAKQKTHYDKSVKPKPDFNIGDNVRVRMGKTWDPAVITSKHSTPRSYGITTAYGDNYRRNSRFLNKSPDQVQIAMPSSFDMGAAKDQRLPDRSVPETEPIDVSVPTEIPASRPTRNRQPPVWHTDYQMH